jgi:hypothetical protein
MPPPNYFPPIRRFSSRSPYYDQYSLKRLVEALSGAIPLFHIGKIASAAHSEAVAKPSGATSGLGFRLTRATIKS